MKRPLRKGPKRRAGKAADKRARGSTAAGNTGSPSLVGGRGELILLVDDFADNREMYAQYLSFQNYRVAEAGDGHDALVKAAALKPDLVVMDLSLPGLDGWEATRRLKRDPVTSHIPVIALTGHALAGHAEGAHAAGCDSFVTKPCVPSDLAAEIRRVLDTTSKPSGR